MKSIDKICVVVQARLNSQRIEKKMIRPFADTTLMDICIKKILDSKVDLVTGDLDQPNALDNLGKFDIVLFAGVFYHLENPFIALRNIKSTLKNGSKLFVETNFSHLNTGDAPHLEFHPKNSLNGDYTNFFSPNPSCLKFMLEEIGDFHLINNETKIAGRRFWQQYVYKK